jgi:hypothetical protein
MKEYKEAMIIKLGKVNNSEEVEQLISRSIERMREKKITADVITDYLDKLKDALKALSPSGFDYLHWCNIRCAILHLKKRTNK